MLNVNRYRYIRTFTGTRSHLLRFCKSTYTYDFPTHDKYAGACQVEFELYYISVDLNLCAIIFSIFPYFCTICIYYNFWIILWIYGSPSKVSLPIVCLLSITVLNDFSLYTATDTIDSDISEPVAKPAKTGDCNYVYTYGTAQFKFDCTRVSQLRI